MHFLEITLFSYLHHKINLMRMHRHYLLNDTHATVLRSFVRVYTGELVLEETSIHSHPSCLSAILIILFHLSRTMASSLLNPSTGQSLCTTSNHVLLAYLWVWSPVLHTPYTSLPKQYPFATHVHTIVACFPLVATLCPLFLVSLNSLFETILQLHATHPPDHSHLCPLMWHLFFSYRPGLTSV